jgi:hypothetical protein
MYTFIFRFRSYKNLALAEKELQQARKNNQALAWYIHVRRKKEEARKEDAWKKTEEEPRKKAMVVA